MSAHNSTKNRKDFRTGHAAGLTVACIAFLAASAFVAAAQTAVTTYHNDNNRTGWNRTESVLTPANVGNSTFGLLQKVTLDDQVDAQPLVVPGVMITAGNFVGTHDVVYVATENNSVYAIDVHTGTVLLSPNFGTPVSYPLGCTNNGPNVGINSTPVIDLSSNILYVMIYTQDASGPAYRLHALDLGSLTDKVTPQLVTASHALFDGSTFNFNATYQRQRPGLLLSNGSIYAGFGSFCDFNANLSRGWLLGWTAGSLTPFPANNLNDLQVNSPNNFFLSSIWMSGYGPATDDSGNVLFVTGNSDPSGTTYDGVTNIQESVVKVPSTLGTVSDLFTPKNQSSLDQGDTDFGSGGVLVLPDQTGSLPHLAVAAGKDGNMYLMDVDKLGGYSTTKNNVVGTYSIGGCWCGQAYFVDSDGVGRVVSSGNSTIQVWKIATSPQVSLTNTTNGSISNGQDPGFFTSISSSGTSNPIIWALSRPTTSNNGAPISLYAFNPDSGGGTMNTLFTSPAGNWPNMGGNANLVPTVANGQVYVASNKQLQIFGLTASPGATTTTLTSSANPSLQGKSVTFTATVTPQSGTGTPTGTVTFQNGTTILATKTLMSGTASYATATLPPGSNNITAVYAGSSPFNGSTSAPLIQSVQAVTTTTVTSSSPNPSVYGQAVLFTATVTSSIGAPPNGELVTFEQGTTVLGTAPLSGGTATFSDSALAVGTRQIRAVYAGDANFATSTSKYINQVVGKATSAVTLSSSQNSSSYKQPVTFTATVAPQFGGTTPTGSVTFYDGATALAWVTLVNGVATYTTTTLPVGTDSITALYRGSGSFLTSTSAPLSQVVTPASSTITLVSSLDPSNVGNSVTLTATVTGAFGGTVTGSVTFMDGTTTLKTLNLNAGAAKYTTTTLPSGTDTITATYNGNTDLSSSSVELTQTVNQ